MIDRYVETAFGLERKFELHDDYVDFAGTQRFGKDSTQRVLLKGLNPSPARIWTRDQQFQTLVMLVGASLIAIMVLAPVIGMAVHGNPEGYGKMLMLLIGLLIITVIFFIAAPQRMEYATFYTTGAVPALSVGWRKKDPRQRFDQFVDRVANQIRVKNSE